MSKIALITGITGQDGSYLAEFLLKKNYKIYGIVRRNSTVFNYKNIDHIKNELNLRYGDLTESSSLFSVISEIINDNKEFSVFEIYNLGAQSHVKISFEIPEYTTNVDATGTLKLLDCIKNLSENIRNKIRFYQASTSEMYGAVLEVPQKETTPFNPQSPYACAKVYSHFLVKNYREGYNLFACSGILFNHESQRRGDNFVTKKVINYVKSIKNKGSLEIDNNIKPLKMGNINSKRDWGHAKDYINGMWLMLQQDNPDDYVLAMGQTTTVRDFINISFLKIGIKLKWQGESVDEKGYDEKTNTVLVEINKKYFRPCEVELLIGDSSKARNKLGWKPEYDTLDKLIDDMLDY
tara:strand:- start:61 stop:1113 length:1053 start_codon:yes stop_codon:yes gene_type:complete